jgi:hypothetical protein
VSTEWQALNLENRSTQKMNWRLLGSGRVNN